MEHNQSGTSATFRKPHSIRTLHCFALLVHRNVLLLDLLGTLLQSIDLCFRRLPWWDSAVEQDVDLLESFLCSFGVWSCMSAVFRTSSHSPYRLTGEEDVEQHRRAEGSEHDIRLPSDVCEGRWQEVREREVEDLDNG